MKFKDFFQLSFEGLILYTALMFVVATIAFPDQMSDDSWIPKDRVETAIVTIVRLSPL